MPEGCINNCTACGRCGNFTILDNFRSGKQDLEPREGFGIAVDIGTTSVVLALVSLFDGKILSRRSFMNPQRVYGPDVISRISAANNGNLEPMRRAITESIASGVKALLKSGGIDAESVSGMVIAGNTVMTHLLLGFPCENLGVYPFKPAFELAESYHYADVFGASGVNCPVRIVPWLAAFVGGDITAGLLNVIPDGKECFMLVDLGTNGELALYDGGTLTVTSTAAGPAFEGSRHGGGASEVLNDLAHLVSEGFVDKTGLLSDSAPNLFSQKEIRDLQLAKSAVRSGLEILLEDGGLAYGDLRAVYLAGGIGQALDDDSAIAVGLLPFGLKGRALAAGNAALGGAVRLLLAPKRAAEDMKKLLAACEINLAVHPRFNDYFIKYMSF